MSASPRQQAHTALAQALQQDPLFAPHADLCWTLGEQLGRGGMGVVHRVRDRALGRVAALKLLHTEEPRRVARFLREARVTARLDHPGIPPVYEAGRNTQGRHYLLMRLVEGKTLEERVATLHGPSRPDSGELRELLHVLVRVAEAVGYAHAQGVVHRDLKPENVMVGAFGEVLVMDWGLAKVHGLAELDSTLLGSDTRVDSGDSSGSSTGSDSRLTVDGAVLGTPGFIAPELLKGQSVDARADVFALGAILATILTGRSPFPGETAHAVLLRNAEADAVLPRDVDASVPGPLDAITRRALAASPQARYPSALAFAAELRTFLAGEPVASYRYSALQRLRAFVGRHAVPLVVVVLMAALGLGAALATSRAASAGAARVRGTIAAQAREASAQAWAAYQAEQEGSASRRIALALRALDAAQRWHATAGDGADAIAARSRAALALAEAGLDAEQLGLASAACGDAESVGAAGAPPLRSRIAEALQRRDEELERVIREAERGELRGRGDRLEDSVLALMRYPDAITVSKLAQALDAISAELETAQRAVWGGAVEPNPAESRDGEPRLDGLLEAFDAYRVGAATPEQLALRQRGFERLLRRTERRADGHDRQLELVLAAVASEQERVLAAPGWRDLASVCCQALGQLGIRDAAVPALTRYLLADADPTRAAVAARSLCLLGGVDARDAVTWGMERFGSQRTYASAVSPWMVFLGEEVESLAGGDAQQLAHRAELELRAGDLESALADLSQAIDLTPRVAGLWARRGHVQRERKALEEALADFQRALELNPKDAAVWNGSASVREDMGDLAGAEADYSRALELSPELAEVWSNRGSVRRSRGDHAGSLEDFDRALALAPEEGRALINRGMTHWFLNDLQAALEDMERAVDMLPENPVGWANLGMILLEIVQREGGEAAQLDRAWTAAQKALELERDLAGPWITRGRIRQLRGDLEGALQDLTRGRQLDDIDFRAMKYRGELYLVLGRPGEALGDLNAGVERSPASPTARMLRAQVLAQLGQVEEALEDAEAFAGLTPGNGQAWSMVGEYQLRLGRRDEALVSLDKALELEPQRAVARVNRGILFHLRGEADKALEDLEVALRLDPGQVVGWVRKGRILYEWGELSLAEVALREAVGRDAQNAEAWLLLANALQDQGRLGEAIAAYDQGGKHDSRSALPLQRGACYLGLGDLPAARRDFEAAATHEAPQPYARLLWFGAGGRAEVLAPLLAQEGWVATLARALSGALSADALLATATTSGPGEPESAAKRCEALCYLGLLAERNGDAARAREHYAAAARSGAKRSLIELLLAEARLKALSD
jgi:tetratricopeptide (TPR) repeat protein